MKAIRVVILAAAVVTALLMPVVGIASLFSQPQTTNKEVQPVTIPNFAQKYLELFATTDDKARKALATELFTEDAEHYAAPANVSFIGRDAILANVAKVNKGAIQEAKLKFKNDKATANHNSILIEWSAEAPSGKIVRTGKDILILNGKGKAKLLYMFTTDH